MYKDINDYLIENTPMQAQKIKRCSFCKGGSDSYHCTLVKKQVSYMYPCTVLNRLICNLKK